MQDVSGEKIRNGVLHKIYPTHEKRKVENTDRDNACCTSKSA